MTAPDRPHAPPRHGWYRQPTVWVGVVLFVASLAGCVWIITVAAGHPDEAVDAAPTGVLGVPATAHSSGSVSAAQP